MLKFLYPLFFTHSMQVTLFFNRYTNDLFYARTLLKHHIIVLLIEVKYTHPNKLFTRNICTIQKNSVLLPSLG